MFLLYFFYWKLHLDKYQCSIWIPRGSKWAFSGIWVIGFKINRIQQTLLIIGWDTRNTQFSGNLQSIFYGDQFKIRISAGLPLPFDWPDFQKLLFLKPTNAIDKDKRKLWNSNLWYRFQETNLNLNPLTSSSTHAQLVSFS